MSCCGGNTSRKKSSTTPSALPVAPAPIIADSATPEGESSLPAGNKPIADLEVAVLVLLSDGKHSQHGYLMAGQYYDIHGRVIENFHPTHYFL